MPSRNAVKTYVAGGVYHVYNRGVEKRDIFLEPKDYSMFLHYLKAFLQPPDPDAEREGVLPRVTQLSLQRSALYHRVELLAFCLMPNHFHLMLRQRDERGMAELMQRLGNAYVEYFNKKQKRVGSLFQGRYKAVQVDVGAHFLLVTRYIHRNPLEMVAARGIASLFDYPYSSYPDYLGIRHTKWVHSEVILDYFPRVKETLPGDITYREFVESDSVDELAPLDESKKLDALRV